jgi:hypothetical protein
VPCDEERPIDNEFVVPFGTPSEKFLQVALDKRVDLIILGSRRPSLAGAISHMAWPQLMRSCAVPDAPC